MNSTTAPAPSYNLDAINQAMFRLTPSDIIKIAANGDQKTLDALLQTVTNTVTDMKHYADNSIAEIKEQFSNELVLQQQEIRDEFRQIHSKIDYHADDKFLTLHALGDTFRPSMRNKMALVLKWLDIVYYNSDSKRFVPRSDKLNTFCRETIKETKQGFRYKEYSYHNEKIQKLLEKKLSKIAINGTDKTMLDVFNSHFDKTERDEWIRTFIEPQIR